MDKGKEGNLHKAGRSRVWFWGGRGGGGGSGWVWMDNKDDIKIGTGEEWHRMH